MHFVSLLYAFAAVAGVNAGSIVPSDDITQALAQGDSAAATVGILSLGKCDLLACTGALSPVVEACASAIASEGKNPSEDLECVVDAVDSATSGSLGACEACIEHAISILNSTISGI